MRGIVDENDSDFDCGELDLDLSPDVKRRKTPYPRISQASNAKDTFYNYFSEFLLGDIMVL